MSILIAVNRYVSSIMLHPITQLLLEDKYDEAKGLFVRSCRNRSHAIALALTIQQELQHAERSSPLQPVDLG